MSTGTAERRWSRLAGLLFQIQPERLIRLGRLFFAAFALLAIYLDPTRPARNLEETYSVLTLYLLYAAILAVAPCREALNARIHYLTHAIDIATFGGLCLLSDELSSPFWAFAGFSLIGSAMRWGFSGALATAFMLITLFVVIGWPYYDPATSDLNSLIMRSAYSLVAAVMLGYFASYRERSRLRLAKLAYWPIEATAKEGEPWLETSLRHASEVLGGLSLLVVWSDDEEPRGRMAYWDGASCMFLDAPGGDGLLRENMSDAGFHSSSIADVLNLPVSIKQRLLTDRPRSDAWCSAAFVTQRYRGQVIAIDPGYPNDEIVFLTQIVAGRIAFELEQFAVMQELASAAGWRERGRLARDLHDSVLQDLTAAGLQLKVAAQRPPEQMQHAMREIGKVLQEQQRRIRGFVENARSKPRDEPRQLKEQLEAFSRPLSAQWGCQMHISVDPADVRVADGLLSAACQIISEATANAVRHGGAGAIDIAVQAGGKHLELQIADNGCGIIDLKATGEERPQSIRARVSDLGGALDLWASSPGLGMRISLPL